MSQYDEILDQVPIGQLADQLGVDESEARRAAEQALPAEVMHGSHADPRARVEHLLARGRADGSFRDDMSIAWQTACYFSLLHGAAAEVRAGRLGEAEVHDALFPSLRALLQVSPER